MGKYIRKSSKKTTKREVAVGVRTRAKTAAAAAAAASGGDGGGGSYLQLRSRRLEKPFVGFEGKRRKCPLKDQRERQGHSWNSCFVDGEEKKEETKNDNSGGGGGGGDGGVEASCGENLLEFDSKDRTTRESTPCSLIRDPDNITTPGSSNRPNNASEANGRVPNSAQRIIPTAHEMNDFFGGSEEKQQKEFIEKYNFDPVNDKPLPGRYEWVKL